MLEIAEGVILVWLGACARSFDAALPNERDVVGADTVERCESEGERMETINPVSCRCGPDSFSGGLGTSKVAVNSRVKIGQRKKRKPEPMQKNVYGARVVWMRFYR